MTISSSLWNVPIIILQRRKRKRVSLLLFYYLSILVFSLNTFTSCFTFPTTNSILHQRSSTTTTSKWIGNNNIKNDNGVILFAKRTAMAKQRMNSRWYPRGKIYRPTEKVPPSISDTSNKKKHDLLFIEELEMKCLRVAAYLIEAKFAEESRNKVTTTTIDSTNNKEEEEEEAIKTRKETEEEEIEGINISTITTYDEKRIRIPERVYELAKGSFQDLCFTREGCKILEDLFQQEIVFEYIKDDDNDDEKVDDNNLIFTDTTTNEINALWEELLLHDDENTTDLIWQGVIYAVQSLCIMGTMAGVTPTYWKKTVQNSNKINPNQPSYRKLDFFDPSPTESTEERTSRMKNDCDITAGTQLLATLRRWKRSSIGAMELLTELGAWNHHENIAILRSGFPITFTDQELSDAQRIVDIAKEKEKDEKNYHNNQNREKENKENETMETTTTTEKTKTPPKLVRPYADIDDEECFGIRRDLTHMKAFTIDSPSAAEIDDGLSVEYNSVTDKYKYWIHIADADRWIGSYSEEQNPIYKVAKRRTVTHYFPTGSVPMIPTSLSVGILSLRPTYASGSGLCALSLGVELNDDGSIDENSIEVMISKIRVVYRLSYDDVDDMLQEGIGYKEEWELGKMLQAAILRRKYRMDNGSVEGLIPYPIPYNNVQVNKKKKAKTAAATMKSSSEEEENDDNDEDNISISVNVETTHNSGMNVTSSSSDTAATALPSALSEANLLVTELMILAGEAMGRWKTKIDAQEAEYCGKFKNKLKLPFRTQKQPDYSSKGEFEYQKYQSIVELASENNNLNYHYCHAWRIRRYYSQVQIITDDDDDDNDNNDNDTNKEETAKQQKQAIKSKAKAHSGIGVQQYVQWTSPIRRLSDLQVHVAVKRYLRRRRIHEWMVNNNGGDNNEEGTNDNNNNNLAHLHKLGITSSDLGCPLPITDNESDENSEDWNKLDQDLQYTKGTAMVRISRQVQRETQQYWMYEYLYREKKKLNKNQQPLVFTAIVLGCIDTVKDRYAIYIQEIGYEYRYTSQLSRNLLEGEELQLQVIDVQPIQGILTLSLFR